MREGRLADDWCHTFSQELLAGGSPAADYFSCAAKKSNQKKAATLRRPSGTHFFRGRSGGCATRPCGAQTVLADFPRTTSEKVATQRGGCTGARSVYLPPLPEPRILTLTGEAEGRRKLSEPGRGEFFRRLGKIKILGVSTAAGRALFAYFLCTGKESKALPDAPGQQTHTYATQSGY